MSAELFDWLLRSAWALAIAVALVMVLRPLWRRWLGAGAVLWLYLLVPAALLATSLPGPTVVADAPFATSLSVPAAASAGVSPSTPASAPTLDTPTVALLAWTAGALALAGWLLAQQRRFRRRLGRLQRRDARVWQASADDIGPVVIGLLRPRIIVPADFDQRYDAQQRELVLAHERVHLRRGDLPVNALACALRCLFWFNPLVHLAAAKLRLDQELACDAAVLARHPRAGRAYATALLNTQLADLGLPVGCAWQSSHPLTWRISMLKKPLPGPARLMLGAGLAVLASSAGAAALWQQQPATVVSLPAISGPLLAVPLPALAVDAAVAAPERRPMPAPKADAPRPAIDTAVPVARPDFAREENLPLPLPLPPLPRGELPVPAPSLDLVADVAPVDYQAPRIRTARPARLPLSAGFDQDVVVTDGIVLQVRIDARGKPVDVRVHESHLGRDFERNAIAAVKRWRFQPARRGGQAVTATVLVPVSFKSSGLDFAAVQAEQLSHPKPTFMPPPQRIAGQ